MEKRHQILGRIFVREISKFFFLGIYVDEGSNFYSIDVVNFCFKPKIAF